MRYKSLPEWEFTSATRLAAGTWTRLSRVFRGQAAPAAGAADLERHRLQIDGVMHQGVGDAQQRLARHRLVHSSGERAELFPRERHFSALSNGSGMTAEQRRAR